jgi:nitrous oxidase accessory protein NosD
VDIADASSKIDINHCRLTGVEVLYPTGSHQLIYSSTTTEDSVYIHSNRFEKGDYGIYLTASGGDLEKDVSIIGNYFRNVRYRSIHTHNHDGLTINGNTIFNDQHDHEGISITASINTKSISGNDIRQLAGGNHGLYLHYVFRHQWHAGSYQ